MSIRRVLAFHAPRIADYNSGNMREQLDSIELELEVGVAKVSKYATRESGDTLEVTERPQGGLSMVLADGQRSGRAAKIISALVARKAIALLAEGVRDGAAARATHDYLRTHRQGQVSAELSIVSLDLATRTIVISRPDVLIYLDASEEVIYRRGERHYVLGYVEEQRHRLAHARAHCDFYLMTDDLSAAEVLARAAAFLGHRGTELSEQGDLTER